MDSHSTELSSELTKLVLILAPTAAAAAAEPFSVILAGATIL